jgi:glycosyltransferase involved in cell wall biosynthesis
MKEMMILILPTRSTFMETDRHILETLYHVKTLYLAQDKSKLSYLTSIFKMSLTLLNKRSYIKVALWFADYHALPAVLISRLMRRKSFILIGGYDAVCYQELGMGVYCSDLRGWCTKTALKSCTHIIANHAALLSSLNTYYKPEGHPDGIYKLIPGLRTPASVVFNAINEPEPENLDQPRKQQILTVGGTPRFQDVQNKGYDLLLEIAARRPDLRFIFIGIRDAWMAELDKKYCIKELPNVILHPFLPREELLALMQESSVYCQPSISEGMPNALMEAMLMGCIPVGSNVAGIPTVIGKHGYVYQKRDSHVLEDTLDKALNLEANRKEISRFVKESFSEQIRKDKLEKIMLRY